MDSFTGDFCQCDHSNQNLMVSEAMGVCMIMGTKATTVAYADKKPNAKASTAVYAGYPLTIRTTYHMAENT